jgi:outer membrane beta-barrel protein
MKALRWFMMALVCHSAMAFAQKSEDEAGDVSEVDKDSAGPLRDRIPPVSGYQFRSGGRFELSPFVGISVRDAFFTKLYFGAAATYHFTNMWALSGRAAFVAPLVSGAAQICETATASRPGGCRPPSFDELTTSGGQPENRSFGLIRFTGSIDLQWAPIYGKLSLSAERFIGFNMYALIGPAAILYGARSTFTVGGNVGIGFRFFFNKWLSLRAELRNTIYWENIDVIPDQTGSVRNQLHAEFGFSMFFPNTFTDE